MKKDEMKGVEEMQDAGSDGTSGYVWQHSLFTPVDVHNFKAGTFYNAHHFFGSRPLRVAGTDGFYFAVWAPNASRVSVISDFNNWVDGAHNLFVRDDTSGIWEGFIPGYPTGARYKYLLVGYKDVRLEKGDPFANFWEKRPATASIACGLQYDWSDDNWMQSRSHHNSLEQPWSIYEVHLASWKRQEGTEADFYNYRQIGVELAAYAVQMGFTHVELMPIMEYPYDGSWGYQGAGYFAPTSRFGSPEDCMNMIDTLHRAGIGVILDWVPSHFPYDAHGLFMFDGTHLYEYADMRKGYHPDWNSYIFDYAKGEVKSFLVSSARFWLEKFHIDGLRVDAVSSMLQLDYSRKEGAWVPNIYGGNENLEAIDFLKALNETVYRDFPDVQTIAEEATNWPKVSKPTYEGGLGFGMKWMMGWMHDTLSYFRTPPDERNGQYQQFVFSIEYFYHENFMLPFSHDEVVHGKKPLLYKMPGDHWQQFANLRLLYTYQFTHPGNKLLFMGDEFGQTTEWNYDRQLDWQLLELDNHRNLQNCVQQLNFLYRQQVALYQLQFHPDGFEWITVNEPAQAVIAYKRKGINSAEDLLVILNMTPEVRHNWKIRVHGKSAWTEIFNSDHPLYGGTGDVYNPFPVCTRIDKKTLFYELTLHLPPLAGIVLK